MNIVVSQNAVDGITSFVSYMRRLGFSRQALMKYKNQMLSFVSQCIQGAVTKRQLKNNSGSCYFRIPNRKVVWVFGFVYYPNNQTVLITGMGLRQGIDEGKKTQSKQIVIPLTENDIRNIVANVLEEVFKFPDLPNGLTPSDTKRELSYLISKLYQDGKISEEEGNKLLHYGLYFNPYYANGFKQDVRN